MTGAPPLRCHDQCGATAVDETAALSEGWTLLSIAKRWRCAECWRALNQAASITGPAVQREDNLPPTSRGALKRETASGIVPPVVKP